MQNSQLHFGVFLAGVCGGALSFGPPLDRTKLLHLVHGTRWNEMLELNRMALAEWLPRNGESRSLSVCLRMIRKRYPWIQWVVSFADACQCGDGTAYRAAGFVLTGYSQASLWVLPPDLAKLNAAPIAHRVKIQDKSSAVSREVLRRTNGRNLCLEKYVERFGGRILPGYQFRYIYFLDPTARNRLTVPVLPFSKIAELGGGMYRGKAVLRSVGSSDVAAPGVQPGEGGSSPTPALHSPTA